MVKGHDWPALGGSCFVRSNPDPVHFAIQTVRSRLGAHATHADDCIKGPRSYPAHAIVNSELPCLVGVSVMRSLVDQSAHTDQNSSVQYVSTNRFFVTYRTSIHRRDHLLPNVAHRLPGHFLRLRPKSSGSNSLRVSSYSRSDSKGSGIQRRVKAPEYDPIHRVCS
jgi:hypothetical protein